MGNAGTVHSAGRVTGEGKEENQKKNLITEARGVGFSQRRVVTGICAM